MPRIDESKKLTASITIKLTKADHDLAQVLADRRQLPLAEWARDRFLEMLGGRGASPAEYAILAELIAVQNVLVDLMMAATRRDILPTAKVQQIVDVAYEKKYEEVAELFKYALSQIEAKWRHQQSVKQPGYEAETLT